MFCCTNKRLLLVMILGVAAVVGLAYAFQWQIVLRLVPFLVILACPLMHLFMMGRHGNHDEKRGSTEKGMKKYSCH